MREEEVRTRLERVIADIDAGRVRVARCTRGHYLGSTVLVATMGLSACAKEAPVEPTPAPDTTARATATAGTVSATASATAEPVPEPEPSASATARPTATAKKTAPVASETPARIIDRPPAMPYMAPDP